MNLHIAPDNVFTNRFYDNLSEIGILENNKVVVRTHENKLRYIKNNLPFAKLYSGNFKKIIGDTAQYDKVFIHQFIPLLYRWVASNKFKELNWMVWGADLYNLPFIDDPIYEPITHSQYIRKNVSLVDMVYKAKVFLFNQQYKDEAYSKIKYVHTWMKGEFHFAKSNLHTLRAEHKEFFYENELPYSQLDGLLTSIERPSPSLDERPTYIVGNAANPVLNHVDVIQHLQQAAVQANLKIPVGYGFPAYTKFLKKELTFFTGGSVEFLEQYMSFPDYLSFLATADGMIMNSVRPQGYGNIFLSQYMGKPVYFNSRNISLPDLTASKIKWRSIDQIPKARKEIIDNKDAIIQLMHHSRLVSLYKEQFS
jgi:hypothetical protein